MELMVVVTLISLIALIAAPSLVRSRSDRLAFAYATEISAAIHNGRARSAGRGGSHLIVYDQAGGGTRGRLLVFEGLDGTAPASVPPGPNPAPGCRRTNQWAFAAAWNTPGAVDAAHLSSLIDFVNLNATSGGSVVQNENIFATARFTTSGSAAPSVIAAFAMCTTPNGSTYFGQGATGTAAIAAMQASTVPFTDVVEIDIARHDSSNNIVGLNRRVIVTGAGAPRIKAE